MAHTHPPEKSLRKSGYTVKKSLRKSDQTIKKSL